jgi:hypothetical protein
MTSSEIPYATEQGIFGGLTGNSLERTGNLIEGSKGRRVRYGEAFWRAHHEAWRRSELNQREYCEAQGIPLKAFGARKLLYRRAGKSCP